MARPPIAAVDILGEESTTSYLDRVQSSSADKKDKPEPPVTPQVPPAVKETLPPFEDGQWTTQTAARYFTGASAVTSVRLPEALMDAIRELKSRDGDAMSHVLALGILEVLAMDEETRALKLNDIWQLAMQGKRASSR